MGRAARRRRLINGRARRRRAAFTAIERLLNRHRHRHRQPPLSFSTDRADCGRKGERISRVRLDLDYDAARRRTRTRRSPVASRPLDRLVRFSVTAAQAQAKPSEPSATAATLLVGTSTRFRRRRPRDPRFDRSPAQKIDFFPPRSIFRYDRCLLSNRAYQR